MSSDSYNPAPVLSTATEFDRVAQSVRKSSKLSPLELIEKFSLNKVANKIYESFENPSSCSNANSSTDCTDNTKVCCGNNTTKSCCQTTQKDMAECRSEKCTEKNDGEKKAVALQFPDRLIPESAYIFTVLQDELQKVYTSRATTSSGHVQDSQKIQDTLPPRLYVLGDTSYSPCCVDVVAAQHVKASIIVHFGTACLNNVKDVEVLYVFGKEKVECSLDKLEQMLNETYNDGNSDVENVAFIYDPEYEYELQDFVSSRFKSDGNGKFVVHDTQIKRPTDGSTIIPETECTDSSDIFTDADTDSLYIPGYKIVSKSPLSADDFTQSGSIFYVTHGTPSPSVLLHLTTLASDIKVIDATNPTSTPNTPKMSLQFRYRNMNVARMASTIGILVNTLSIRDLTGSISRVQSWITAAGKKYYTFVVGKPNVPKLANFDVVDVWVILGCPRGGIIMSSTGGSDPDYNKPIITPYELKMALKSTPTWTGKWYIEFENVINNMKNVGLGDEDEEDETEENSQDERSDDESEAPVFDPVTGKLVSNSRPLHTRRITHLDIKQEDDQDNNNTYTKYGSSSDSKGLVVKHSSHLVIRNTVSTAADYVYNKLTWTGLGSDFKQQDETDSEEEKEGDEGKDKRFAKVEKGRGGVARNYGIVGEDS